MNLVKSKEVFKANSRTFSISSLLLKKNKLNNVVILYEFCRMIDDIADKGKDIQNSKKILKDIKKELINKHSESLVIQNFITFINVNNLSYKYIGLLMDGIISDCETNIIKKTEAELLDYCFKVAGTIGALMCNLLEVKSSNLEKSYEYAISLGIAMQLTNIARDVLEDANNNRVYIPQEYFSCKQMVWAQDIINGNRSEVSRACEKIILLSEKYYQKAKVGYKFLPLDAKITVFLSATLYGAIGKKIQKNNFKYWEGRTSLTTYGKIKFLLRYFLLIQLGYLKKLSRF